GGQLRIAYAGHGEGKRIAALLSTSPADHRGRIHPGVTGKLARHKLHPRFAFRLGTLRAFEQRPRKHSRLLLGISGGKLAWIAVANPRRLRSTKALKR